MIDFRVLGFTSGSFLSDSLLLPAVSSAVDFQ